MEIKTYKKDAFYSYTLGAFPTMELLKNHPETVLKVLFHSSFQNQEVQQKILQFPLNAERCVNDKLIAKLSPKENCYVAAVFSKYSMQLSRQNQHLVLVNPMNMGNFGTILRSALGFGFTDIAVIRPAIDIFDPKVLRAAMGAFFSCSIEYFPTIEDYRKRFPEHRLFSFMLQAPRLLQETSLPFDAPISLVFGNESSGLPEEYLNEDSLRIQHASAIDSLNLPTAVGIALYEISRQRKRLEK